MQKAECMIKQHAKHTNAPLNLITLSIYESTIKNSKLQINIRYNEVNPILKDGTTVKTSELINKNIGAQNNPHNR